MALTISICLVNVTSSRIYSRLHSTRTPSLSTIDNLEYSPSGTHGKLTANWKSIAKIISLFMKLVLTFTRDLEDKKFIA